jgi:hypothetical protein
MPVLPFCSSMPPVFSKPTEEIPVSTSRKRTLARKLMSEDNIHQDAVKRRRQEGFEKGTTPSSTVKEPTSHQVPARPRQASVEVVDDEIPAASKDPKVFLEVVDDEAERMEEDSELKNMPPLEDLEPDEGDNEMDGDVITELMAEAELGRFEHTGRKIVLAD